MIWDQWFLGVTKCQRAKRNGGLAGGPVEVVDRFTGLDDEDTFGAELAESCADVDEEPGVAAKEASQRGGEDGSESLTRRRSC